MKRIVVMVGSPLVLFLGLLIMSFYGVQSSQKFDTKEYRRMVSATFSTLDDITCLFPRNALEVEQRARETMKMATEEIAKVVAIPAQDRTFENTIRALDYAGRRFVIGFDFISFCKLISPDAVLREAAAQAVVMLSHFQVDEWLSKDVYRAFKEYVDGRLAHETLKEEERYFIDEQKRLFKKAGLELEGDLFERVQKLKKELAQLAVTFNVNIDNDVLTIVVSEAELDGISDDIKRALTRDTQGFYHVGCDYPTFFEVMQFCTVASTRKKLYLAFQNRAYPDNRECLHTIIRKRDELALLLGYESYAHFDVDAGMARTVEHVEEFLSSLVVKASVQAEREYACLKEELPRGIALTADGMFEPWDVAFVRDLYKRKHFNVDNRKIAEYFPVDSTIEGVFKIYQEFLGIDFQYDTPSGVWHEDVRSILVKERATGRPYGYIFLDLYPRPNKYPHACCVSLIPPLLTYKDDGSEERLIAVCGIIANLPKATPGKPALLKHDDVSTFFHEFGHALHVVLGATLMTGFAGYNVKWDFVEMPSQMFEEWMWDRAMLKKVSKHYKTGEPLADEVINALVGLKRFDAASQVVRQVVLAMLSLECFKPGGSKDVSALHKKLHERFVPWIRFEPEAHFEASFGHLEGYGAKYYGYLWSKVYALDLFEHIKKHGLLNEEIGKVFARTVLGVGGSKDPSDILRQFLGREPRQDAFLKDLGLY